MPIRYAAASDIAAIVALARQEHALSHWADVPFDPDATAATALSFIQSPGKTALVSEGGYLAGMVQPLGFTRRLVAIEYAWFAVDGSGMRLLGKFERWARNMGAVCVTAHSFANEPRLERVMTKRCGYKKLGVAMSKNLEA